MDREMLELVRLQLQELLFINFMLLILLPILLYLTMRILLLVIMMEQVYMEDRLIILDMAWVDNSMEDIREFTLLVPPHLILEHPMELRLSIQAVQQEYTME